MVKYHLLLCATSSKAKCCDYDLGEASWIQLKKLIKLNRLEELSNPKGVVLRSKVDCLRVCKEGPILLVWPDGIWYGNVTPERIEVIVNQHILQGKPMVDWIIKHTPQSIK